MTSPINSANNSPDFPRFPPAASVRSGDPDVIVDTQRPLCEQPLAHRQTGRDAGFRDKLMANWRGTAIAAGPHAMTHIGVNALSAAIRHSNISNALVPQSISTGAQIVAGFATGMLATSALHYSGLDKELHGTSLSREEELEKQKERTLIAALSSGAASIPTAIVLNVTANSLLGQAVTDKSALAVVAEEAASGITSSVVMVAGVGAVYAANPSARELIENTATKLTQRTGDAYRWVGTKINLARAWLRGVAAIEDPEIGLQEISTAATDPAITVPEPVRRP